MPRKTDQSNAHHGKVPWKQRILRELFRYFISVIYLAVFLGAFAWYRRFVLDEYRISSFNYGAAVIEALILGKVIWIGEVIGLERNRENRPLLYPTLRQAFVFTIFVGIFTIIEHMIGGLIEGVGVAGGLAKLWHEGKYELIARCLVVYLAFIPFFAFRQLAKTMGEGKLWQLFIGRKLPEFGAPA